MTAPAEIEDPKHRQAWDLLEAGDAHSAVAKTVGVTRGTVSRWVTKWRNQFDAPDLFVTEATAARAKKTQAARAERERRWTEAKLPVEQAATEFTLELLEKAREALRNLDVATITASDLRQMLVSFGIAVDKLQDITGAEQRPGQPGSGMSMRDVDQAFHELIGDLRAVYGGSS